MLSSLVQYQPGAKTWMTPGKMSRTDKNGKKVRNVTVKAGFQCHLVRQLLLIWVRNLEGGVP